jgi:hypothetical protein
MVNSSYATIIGTKLGSFLNNKTGKFELSSVPIKFNKSITNIEFYYYGIPLNTNCEKIIGAGGKSDEISTIK